MNHRILSALLVACVVFPCPAARFEIGPHHFTLPDGFEIALAAGTNLVQRPVECDFDEQGRLYVTDSSGSNDKVQKQLEEKPHRILALEDRDGDGRFEKSWVFADRMPFLEGAMWLDGSLYAAAPPSIWKLTDTNHDGVADVRVEWLQGKTLTGCANDLHGPYLGPDGWIYWCKGAFAKQTYTLPDGKELNTRASHIFRARPDGTRIEPVLTGGMDNPVGLAFTPEGERILSCTFFQHPGGGHRDGLIHAIYGGVYGKDHDVLDGHVRTGDLMPVLTHLGPAAPCGMLRYESEVLGSEYRDNLFVCTFNLHKVVRCVLKRSGATFTTSDSDFLVSDNPDFHPTDIIEDADGSVLVVDTGGWYKLCCPTSQLYKPDVLGAIYRIRRTGSPKVEDAWGRKINWQDTGSDELVKLLQDGRPRVAAHANRTLAKAQKEAIPVLEKALRAADRAEASQRIVWALAQMDSPTAREVIRNWMESRGAKNDSTMLVALHAASLWRDADATKAAAHAVASTNAAVRRAAVELLGKMGHSGTAAELLHAAVSAQPLDRVMEHSLIYALVQRNEVQATRAGLQSPSAAARRIALIALDQMGTGTLRADEAAPLLKSSEPTLKQAAAWIISHHPEWGPALAEFFIAEFSKPLTPAEVEPLQRQLTALLKNGAMQEAVSGLLAKESLPKASRMALLQSISRAGLTDVPASWQKRLIAELISSDASILSEAVNAARAISGRQMQPALREALIGVARSTANADDTRLAALAASEAIPEDTFALVRANISATKPIALRSSAAAVTARARLSTDQLSLLAESVKVAGPLELPKILAAFSRCKDEAIGTKLIGALKDAPALGSLRAETIANALTNFPASVREQAKPLIASLNADTAKEQQHVQELLASLHGGDVRRGQALFNNEKTACSSCHAIGYLGGNVGPDLTRIGQIRTERDLLEAIVYPSASFVRSYEPMIVTTKEGDDYNGVLRKDAADEVVLATGPNTEQRIPRADITDMRPGTVSVMPAGLADQLSKQELADLLAFLKATKW